uniref:NADH dehydrogenase subunit 3 n=1 Tax=Sclomina guangxiensis TaxID=1524607 RepID=UPI002551E00E|nr:NADH dehydrogenase subunit 3 [Sclomina guangxiensis]WGT89386.1 NADH dehydrogenase subunit 3 [Sclomina guangxiensis]WGT89399.1 NADH dehydrogenase subunit 3 [Sclomina guangxiensis]WGT89412.1 NADH dehydrogenase subunit 3 [Sclomina guangxiensis]WGT89425.1 NADH dehydrogenase subunit 3 [Sclomina guangxiensis]WGT89438.1 NADH dehydrogenase subunit 3 [Sclomina guangxiensis]
MFTVLSSVALVMLISLSLILICTIISKKSILDREKMSPFECGFDPKSSSRMPFSIQFFLLAVLFLIFDIEIVIILPMIIVMKSSIMKIWFLTVSTFIVILLIGLYHEWKNGVLEWAN